MDRPKDVAARFERIGTVTLVSQFEAVAGLEGIELHWQFGRPEGVTSSMIERAERADGPWIRPPLEMSDHDGLSVALDRSVSIEREYLYRLIAILSDGREIIFGPIRPSRLERPGASAITLVLPNPSANAVQFQFAVARGGRVSLTIGDLAGRNVAMLVDGIRAPGRYAAVWDGAGSRGRVPPGIYLARLVTPDGTLARRFAIIR
jgi:hypothetical protein